MPKIDIGKNPTTDPNKYSYNNLAGLLGLLLAIFLIITAYRYFNKTFNNIENPQGEGEITSGETSTRIDATQDIKNQDCPKENEDWIANDYKKSDMTGSIYEVKCGDTLWEIAEAYYGDGFAWTEILQANEGSIGFLANGEQALIIPGQVLTIPTV